MYSCSPLLTVVRAAVAQPYHELKAPSSTKGARSATTSSTNAMMEGDASAQPARRVEPSDKQLNFTCAEFDPLAALQTPGLQPPVPEAPVLDNVSKCAALVPAEGSQQSRSKPHVVSEEEKARLEQEQQAKKAKAAALKQRAQRTAQRAEASVRTQSLAAIMSAAAKGPLEALARWQASGQRVLVVTRHAVGVRGRAVGTIIAFDRFLNLILADVEESYTVIVKVARTKQQQPSQQQCIGDKSSTHFHPDPGQTWPPPLHYVQQQSGKNQQQQQQQIAEIMGLHVNPQQTAEDGLQQPEQGAVSRTRIRWCRKQEHRFRKLSQVLLKGDNIVLVSGQPP